MPRVAPALKTDELRTTEIETPQPAPRKLKGTGAAKEALEPERIEPVEGARVDPEWVANMAFAKEKVTVRLLDSTESNSEKVVRVWNNGDPMDFPRNVEVTCERRFVESLCRAKPTTYSQKAIMDEHGGVRDYQNISHRALRYPFAIVRDDNPQGPQWLKSILAQP